MARKATTPKTASKTSAEAPAPAEPAAKSTKSAPAAPAVMPPVSEQTVRDLAQVFKLMSDETRLRILILLAQHRELHVTELCEKLGQSQPAVSHHLALLRVSGLIESRREGKHNFYSVRGDHFGSLMIDLFSAGGPIPKKIEFHDFQLLYKG